MICFQQGSPARHFGHLPFAATLKNEGQSALSAFCGRQTVTQARVAPLREVIATGRRGPFSGPVASEQRATPSKIFPLEAFGGLSLNEQIVGVESQGDKTRAQKQKGKKCSNTKRRTYTIHPIAQT